MVSGIDTTYKIKVQKDIGIGGINCPCCITGTKKEHRVSANRKLRRQEKMKISQIRP